MPLHKESVAFSSHVFVDEVLFFALLKCSLSLSVAEKSRVLRSLPVLSQFQVDELIRVFISERKEFVELIETEGSIIEGLIVKALTEWQTIEEYFIIPVDLDISEDEVVERIHIFELGQKQLIVFL